MELGLLVIFALRILIPLTIFRWPLYGAIASLIIDALDTNIVKLFGIAIPDYVTTDKLLDMYYLSIELFVSLLWTNTLAKKGSIFLYIWRFIGVILFELNPTQRVLLFLAPNIFEHFFLLITLLQKFGKETKKKMWINSFSKLFVVIFILWLTKIPQELVLHVYKVGQPVEEFFKWVSEILK